MVTKKQILDKIHAPGWVVLILAVIFLLRIPTFFEPYHYGDEMIYLNLGEAMKRGMVLYRDIHDNKPPLLYIIAGISGGVFMFRAILAGWMMFTTILFWRLADSLFPKNSLVVKVSTVTFALLTTLPLLEGRIPNAELFMLAPTMAAFLILLTQKLNTKNLLIAGVFFSVSTLFKVPAAFDLGAIAFLWFVSIKLRGKEVVAMTKQLVILLIGFAIPILLTIIWYWLRGALSEYWVAAFAQNVGYLSSWRPSDVAEPFLTRNGPLLMRFGVLFSGLALLYLFRGKLTKKFIFITGWLLFSLFAATLSERPYPHYLVQLVPSVSLLIGMLAGARSIEQSLAILPIFLVLMTVVRYQFWYYPSLPYYQRFMSFATGQLSKNDYFTGFDKNAPRNYKIAEFLISSSQKEDTVFVWGDSSTIYALSKRLPPVRYVADYHITDFSNQEEIISQLYTKKPKFIITLPDARPFPLLSGFLQDGYLLIQNIDGAAVWKSTNLSDKR